jgi:hypothetical protein
MKEEVNDLFGRVHGAGNEKALATVTAIIDGMGSCGAALGPLLTGYLSQTAGGFDNVFLMLYAASLAAAALLLHLVVHEVCPTQHCLFFHTMSALLSCRAGTSAISWSSG